MKKIISISILVAVLFGIVSSFLATWFNVPEWCKFLFGGGGTTLAFAVGAVSVRSISEDALRVIRQWHGTVNQQMGNITNVLDRLKAHAVDWKVPEEYLDHLTDSYQRLLVLINTCSQSTGSGADRTLRNALLENTVGFCLSSIRSWAYNQYYNGTISISDVHLLGFFLPGENSGHHERKDPTDAKALVKVNVTHMDSATVIIDNSYTENAALVKHGWPEGVHNAVIIIYDTDGVTEVYHKLTSRLHTRISLPESTRGKQLIAKAAFLQHVDDTPKFGDAHPMFTMPRSTEDLIKTLDVQHKEEHAARLQEIELHRQDVERLQKELDEEKAKNKK